MKRIAIALATAQALAACSGGDDKDDEDAVASPTTSASDTPVVTVTDPRAWMRLDVAKGSEDVFGELKLYADGAELQQFPRQDGGCADSRFPWLSGVSGDPTDAMISATLGPASDPYPAWGFYTSMSANILDASSLDGFSPGEPYAFEVRLLNTDGPWTGTFDFPDDFVLTSPPTPEIDPSADVTVAWGASSPGAVVEVEIAWADTDTRTYCSWKDTGSLTLTPEMLSVGDPSTVDVWVRRRELVYVPLDLLDGAGTLVAEIAIEAESLAP